MGLSRRKFTKEFKEAAVRRVEMGIPVAEVARACEVNPNVLRRWRRELRQFGGRAFSGPGQSRAEEQRTATLERKVGQRRWKSIFCGDACSMSKSSGSCRRGLRAARLSVPGKRNEAGEPDGIAQTVPAGAGQPSWALSLAEASDQDGRSGPGSAGCDPAHCTGISLLRQPPHGDRIRAPRLEGQSQAGAAADAGG